MTTLAPLRPERVPSATGTDAATGNDRDYTCEVELTIGQGKARQRSRRGPALVYWSHESSYIGPKPPNCSTSMLLGPAVSSVGIRDCPAICCSPCWFCRLCL
jgi:hypothetical protein